VRSVLADEVLGLHGAHDAADGAHGALDVPATRELLEAHPGSLRMLLHRL
jgi:hypothetical protein